MASVLDMDASFFRDKRQESRDKTAWPRDCKE